MKGLREEIPSNFPILELCKTICWYGRPRWDDPLRLSRKWAEAVEHGLSQYEEQGDRAMPSRTIMLIRQSLLDPLVLAPTSINIVANGLNVVMAFYCGPPTPMAIPTWSANNKPIVSSATMAVSSVGHSAAQHAANMADFFPSEDWRHFPILWRCSEASAYLVKAWRATYELMRRWIEFKFTVKGKNYVWVRCLWGQRKSPWMRR